MANTILNPRDPHNAHDGKQVSLVSLSLNGKYAVTYSEDDKSIEGWIVENSELILDHEANVYKLPKEWTYIYEIKVNDSKIVCYSSYDNIEIFQMSTEHQQIELNPPPESLVEYKINFKKEGNLVIFNNDKISIYHSKHDMSNELSLMSSYELSSCNKLITGKLIDYIKKVINGVFIDDDNIWVISPHYLFHWDLETFQLKFSYSLGFTAKYYEHGKLTVLTKGNSIAVKYMDYEINEIAIFLKDVHFPIRNIQLKDTDTKIEFCEVQNNDYLLAFNLPRKDEKQNIILYNITDINAQPKDASMIFNENKFILYEYNSESKKAFGLVDGKFSYINLLDLNWHEFFESHKEDDDLVGWNDYLCQTFKKYYYNDTLAFPDMENIRSLLSESKNMKEVVRSLFSHEYENKNIATKDINFNNQKYKWRIELKIDKLDKLDKLDELDKLDKLDELDELDELGKLDKLSVYSDKEFLCSKDLGIKFTKFTRLNWKILNNNALALRLDYNGFIIIYEYDIHNKCIKTQYFVYKRKMLNIKDFSGPILPMIIATEIADLDTNINRKQYFTVLSESIISIIEDERCLAKYGPTLLSNLIKSTDSELTCHIEDIYNKCINLVKENPKRNMKFLNIIISSMNDLYKKYPDYIIKFNSEMFMILDPSDERVHSDGDHSHFYTLSDENIVRGRKYFILNQVFLLILVKKNFIQIGMAKQLLILNGKHLEGYIILLFGQYLWFFLQFIWNPRKYFTSIWNLFDSLNEQNPNDSNNPWTLSNTYNQVDENGNILNETLIQVPSENTNLFYSYPTSLLATYLFLTGNQNSLSPWAPKPTTENTILFILMAVFSFLIVIYLMNLFIGLLNMAIEKDNDRALYLVQKAEVLAEIELFYLLPHQRRWRSWFPEVIYCRVDVEKTRIYIKEAIKKGTVFTDYI
ncbi:hypothetical protein RhiirA1_440871 [Rhizophagus irregularis]|uniref:Ion transport domain-containing protein n=1 Tax=Rhizophagus irregularis TaxID=588596 RepID=A0A2N0RXH8_9GLOM|nr:hypothetical protein RhiirA1_440871 [Rhizophagus irregularis]